MQVLASFGSDTEARNVRVVCFGKRRSRCVALLEKVFNQPGVLPDT